MMPRKGMQVASPYDAGVVGVVASVDNRRQTCRVRWSDGSESLPTFDYFDREYVLAPSCSVCGGSFQSCTC